MVSRPVPAHKTVFLAFTMILILISCTTAPATTQDAPSPSATPLIQQAQAPTAIPAPTSTLFVPKAVIKIVTQSPLSGNLALFGQDIARGAQVAVEQLAGGLAQQGYDVELSTYDDKNNLDIAQANAAKIVADPEALCVVGHYGGHLTIQLADTYHAAGLALVSPSVDNSALTEAGYPEISRIVGRRDAQGIAGAQFAKAQGFTNVYIVVQKEEETLRNADYFKVEADGSGLHTLDMVILDVLDKPDPVIADIVKDNPQLVYFAGMADRAIPFFRKARAAGYTGTFLGLEDLNNPALYGPADSSLVEGGGLYYTIMSAPASFYPDTAQFIEDFNIRYDGSPLLFAARAYDATGICIKAIENASREIGGGVPTREQVARAIRALSNYQGITGTYNFNEKGDITLAQYYVYKVVSVDPSGWDQNFIVGSYDVAP